MPSPWVRRMVREQQQTIKTAYHPRYIDGGNRCERAETTRDCPHPHDWYQEPKGRYSDDSATRADDCPNGLPCHPHDNPVECEPYKPHDDMQEPYDPVWADIYDEHTVQAEFLGSQD